MAGDKAAEQHLEKIEKARVNANVSTSLQLERELIEVAKSQFDLISPLEYDDLVRLRDDRNRCAHPSLVSADQAFVPPGELARLHIRSAVVHLLQHQPVQGKYALDRLLRQVESEYFPIDVDKARSVFSSGPLNKPRETLVRNLIVILLKRLLPAPTDYNLAARMRTALHAISQLQHNVFDKVICESLPPLIRGLPDNKLIDGVLLIAKGIGRWPAIDIDVRTKIEIFVQNLPTCYFIYIDDLLDYEPLNNYATARVQISSRDEIIAAPFFYLPPAVAEKYIELYLKVKNYAEANQFGSDIANWRYLDFSADQQFLIIRGIQHNSQIRESKALPSVIAALRKSNKIPAEEFDTVLTENSLSKYVTRANLEEDQD
ncbi:hypothetical protein [Methylocella tundrae]|uniref:hypothetical protein n=1 Tax=Methylocella tundrae TaxID=227605 RepID=UPI0030FEA1D2|nr:hypothetical protein SIN04_11670 [Methylocella tundrae]